MIDDVMCRMNESVNYCLHAPVEKYYTTRKCTNATLLCWICFTLIYGLYLNLLGSYRFKDCLRTWSLP